MSRADDASNMGGEEFNTAAGGAVGMGVKREDSQISNCANVYIRELLERCSPGGANGTPRGAAEDQNTQLEYFDS